MLVTSLARSSISICLLLKSPIRAVSKVYFYVALFELILLRVLGLSINACCARIRRSLSSY